MRAVCEILERRRLLSTVLVNTLLDETAANATTSLREAIAMAPAGDTIQFQSGLTGLIDLVGAKELVIDKNLTLAGPGPGAIQVSGVQASRVFRVTVGVTATISGIRILDGDAESGAGIYSEAQLLTLNDVVIANCIATGKIGDAGPQGTSNPDGGDARGGGIYNAGKLQVTNLTLGGNKAIGGPGVPSATAAGKGGTAMGAGLYNASGAQALISVSTIAGNNAVGGEGYKHTMGGFGGAARGAGIFNAGSLSVSDSTFSGNGATAHDGADAYMGPGGDGGVGEGGALYNSGTADIVRCDLNSNLAIGGEGGHASVYFFEATAAGGYASGGAIHSVNAILITNSRVRGNVARAGRGAYSEGGGIYSRGGLTLAGSTVDGNAARWRSDLPGVDGRTGGAGIGGGISAANATITSSTISNNVAEGGVGGQGYIIKLTTVPAGYGGAARGGGLFLTGDVTINNSTIAKNTAIAGSGAPANYTIRAGNGGDASGGGLFAALGAKVEAWSVTVAANKAIEGKGGAVSAPFTDGSSGTSSGGGIEQQGIASPLSSIVAGNAALMSPDVHGAFASHGFNLIGKSDGSSGWIASDLKGTVASPLDAKLSELADNGGATKTMLPLPSSPAVDAGAHTSNFDQRGLSRPFDVLTRPNASGSDGSDIGAVELQPASYPGAPLAIGASGAKLQLENFDAGGEGVAYHDLDAANLGGAYRPSDPVDLQSTSDTAGGYNVGWAVAGEWLNYSVDVTDAGLYTIEFRVASNGPGGKFHLEVDGTDVTQLLTVPNTWGWQNWTTITKSNVTLTRGRHVLRLVMDSAGSTGAVGNFNFMTFTYSGPLETQAPFKGAPIVVGSTAVVIEAEDFDKGGEKVGYHDVESANAGGQYRPAEAVDIQATTDVGGGFNVGWARAGEWLEYSIDVTSSGLRTFEFRLASTGSNGAFHAEVDGVNVTGPIVVPNTGGWQNWLTVKGLATGLSPGKHVIRLVMDTDGTTGAVANFNYLKISPTLIPISKLISDTAAYVRDGSFADTNYGAEAQLLVKDSTPGFDRESFIKFDVSSVPEINSATLNLFGNLWDSVQFPVNVEVSWTTSGWSESGITWNNQPKDRLPLGTIPVSGTAGKWYQLDVTNILKSEKVTERNIVSFVLRSLTLTSTVCAFAADGTANAPYLMIT